MSKINTILLLGVIFSTSLTIIGHLNNPIKSPFMELKYTENIKRYAYILCGDKQRAEDLIQDTFLSLLERKKPISDENMDAYITTCLRNKFIDQTRKRRIVVDGNISSLIEIPDEVPEEELLDDLIVDKLGRLKSKEREVVILKCSGYSYREIGQLLHMTEGTSKWTYSYAIKSMQER